jgi:ankyrin repeat protein
MGAAAEKRHEPSRASPVDAELLQQPDSAVGRPAVETDAAILAAKAGIADRLVAAAFNGELGDVKLLAARVGFNTAASDGRYSGLTPLMAAADRGRTDVVSFLIDAGADLDATDPQGQTALMRAVQMQRTEAVSLLLEAGASATAVGGDDGATALHMAAMRPRHELVASLLKKLPPAAREAKDNDGRTAVHMAARNGCNAGLVLLLDAKCKVDACDSEGCTPLLRASESGRAQSVRILLKRRANLNAKSALDRSALDMARTWGHERVLEVLTEVAE